MGKTKFTKHFVKHTAVGYRLIFIFPPRHEQKNPCMLVDSRTTIFPTIQAEYRGHEIYYNSVRDFTIFGIAGISALIS